MHEMALMGDILNIIKEDVNKRNIQKVDKVELLVGELSNALPDALELAFDAFKAQDLGFLDKEATLEITIEKAQAVCVVCEKDYYPDQRIAVCPVCNFPSGKLITGEAFRVSSYSGA